ncbi:DNA excision repair protein ERCC-6-like [Clavelina lepadiformis]|uniref:DNA excision repair protein ERCC-6-like n=1 Tax=Clavelina lepadiformis TaxID=159417 RepID=UPI004041CFE3
MDSVECESDPDVVSHQDSELELIPGVDIYDANILQKGIVEKFNKAFLEKQAHDLLKKIESIKRDIRNINILLEQTEKQRSHISSKNYSEVSLLKLKSLNSQIQKYQQRLRSLSTNLDKTQFSLHLLNDEANKNLKEKTEANNVLSNQEITRTSTASVLDIDFSSAKTLKERKVLIKRGLATPTPLAVPAKKLKTTKPAIKLDGTFGDSLFSNDTDNLQKKSKQPEKPLKNNEQSSPIKKKQKEKLSASDNLCLSPTKASNVKKETKESKKDEDDYVPSDDYGECDDVELEEELDQKLPCRRRVIVDDANPKNHQKRLAHYKKQLLKDMQEGYEEPEDKILPGGLKVPGRIWQRLYKYQKTGVKWLWELHTQQTGGILGDEMGLGKTIQVIAFLAALQKSKVHDYDASYNYHGLGPVLIVAPATVMHQWVRELHSWAPSLRVAILHNSGTHKGSQSALIDNMTLSRGILVTSYERVRLALENLLSKSWHYVILDEGHKIRNPEATITHSVKMFATPHRIILSGSPIQNHLRELWSLFDFVFPGKLGTLQVFMEQFSVPIIQGGYANASEIQVQTAYKCACMLRNTIAPYLLRRLKQDVQSHIKLPEKRDQVLFCSLTDQQVEVYQNYLNSDSVESILRGSLKIFVGLIHLRKICNHPDLYTGGHKLLAGEEIPGPDDEKRFGHWKRSGKMIVVESLLRIWKKQKKKVLLFTQSKMMLDVLEDFIKSQNYTYLTMHGGSAISSRQPMINKFNSDPNIFVFILTTRVGGLGVNLIGADRVILYDPDWNPSTDSQAQERAWRIGQKKQVTIYRLLTTGTIEEKIYHRQIFKHFMSNRILKDPKQRRFFKANSLHELFTLGDQTTDDKKSKTETAAIFAGTGSEIQLQRNSNSHNRKALSHITRKLVTDVAYKNVSQMSILLTNKSKAFNRNKNLEANGDIDDDIPPVCTSEETGLKDNQQSFSTSFANSTVTSTSQDHLSSLTKSSLQSFEPDGSNEPCCSSSSTKYNDNNPEFLSNDFIKSTPNETIESEKDQIVGDVESNGVLETQSSLGKRSLKDSYLKVLEKFKQNKAKSIPKPSNKSAKKKNKPDVDGEAVKNVVRKSKFKQQKDDEGNNKADEYVLSKLLNKGVHSAMQHNVIMNSANSDYAIVESEASRVAKEAVRNLRLSRQQYQYPSASRKKFGKTVKRKKVAAKKYDTTNSSDDDETIHGPFKSSSGPCSSADLLKRMKLRNHIEKPIESSDEEEFSDLDDKDLTNDDLLVRSLASFISSRPGKEVSTSQVMANFKEKVSISQAPNFRSMLHQICWKVNDTDGECSWKLKPEFH